MASTSTPNLLEILTERETQARDARAPYLALVPDKDSMLYWLSAAAVAARKAGGRRQIHAAASANRDQSSIARFEKAEGWPRDPDLVVNGYADDLDVPPVELWKAAVQMWQDHAATPIERTP